MGLNILCFIACALVLSGFSVFFALGGVADRNEILHRAKQPEGKKLLIIIGAAELGIGIYGAWLFGIGYDWVAFFALASYLLAITPEDIRQHTIADAATLTFGVLFLLLRLSRFQTVELIDALLGAAVGVVLLGLPYLIRRSSIGLGDVKILAVCGLMLGPIGVITFLMRAFLAIFVYSLVQLIRKKVTLHSETPFAPFLLLAALI